MRIPAAGGQHGGGQGFFERCIAFVFAPTALEQGLARGVHVKRTAVGGEVHINSHVRPLRVDVGTFAAFVAKAVGHGVFDFEGCKIQAGERAVLRCDFNFEGLLGGEPNFPRHSKGSVVQIFFTSIKSL